MDDKAEAVPAPPVRPVFRSLSGLSALLKWLLWLIVVTGLAMMLIELARMMIGSQSEVLLLKNDTQQRWMGSLGLARFGLVALGLGLVILTGLTFLNWTSRANRNARLLGAENMTFTPLFAWLWYLIPGWNFWKPFLVMSEIWRASRWPKTWAEHKNWHDENASASLPWWWSLSLVALALIGRAGFATYQKENEAVWWMAAALAVVLAALAAKVLVRQVNDMQLEARHDADMAS